MLNFWPKSKSNPVEEGWFSSIHDAGAFVHPEVKPKQSTNK